MTPTTKPRTLAFRSANLFELGIGYVVISRFKATGASETGVFLVDVCCLGVKNGFFTKWGPGEYEDQLERTLAADARFDLSPACGRKLVEDAVAYAAKLGLPPHRDYKLAARVLGGINAGECDTEFTFGRDGKPFYAQGPNDSPAFVERVLFSLLKHCGEGGYHYLLSLGDGDV